MAYHYGIRVADEPDPSPGLGCPAPSTGLRGFTGVADAALVTGPPAARRAVLRRSAQVGDDVLRLDRETAQDGRHAGNDDIPNTPDVSETELREGPAAD
jgi:hypothetical protein